MPNPKKLKFICTRCGNCCTDRNTLVNVTYLDILRIVKGLKLSLEESLEIFGFYVYTETLDNNVLKKMVISPIETERGLAFIGLMKKDNFECYFYDAENKRCLIHSLRPMFCRSFPFSFIPFRGKDKSSEEKIEIIYTKKATEYCPGIGNDAPLIDIDYWFNLANNTLSELKDNYTFNKKWNNSIKKKEILPSAKNYIKIIFELIED
ncbi:MAG: YkgJ family cysteine cluster protein [Candidatus Thorarchaeota archaeon]